MASSTIWTNSDPDGLKLKSELRRRLKLFCKSPARRQDFLSLQSARGPPGKKKKNKVLPVWLCVCEQVCVSR